MEESVAKWYLKISKALESQDTSEVLVSLKSLPKNIGTKQHHKEILGFLYKYLPYDMEKKKKETVQVLQILFEGLTDQDVRDATLHIVDLQIPVASDVAVDCMSRLDFIYSRTDCESIAARRDLFLKDDIDETNVNGWLNRCGFVNKLVRVSGYASHREKRQMELELEYAIDYLRENSPHDEIRVSHQFAREMAVVMPCHPLLELREDEPDDDYPYIAEVYSNSHRAMLIAEQYCLYLENEIFNARRDSLILFRLFQIIIYRSIDIETFYSRHINLFTRVWMCMLRTSNGLGTQDMQLSAKLLGDFVKQIRLKPSAVFLTKLLNTISMNTMSDYIYEPQFVACIVDQFRFKIKDHAEYREEMAEFWRNVAAVKYSNMYHATAYYMAVCQLAKAQALFKINKHLCEAVFSTIMVPMHEQMVDFKRMRKVEELKAQRNMIPEVNPEDNLGSGMFPMLSYMHQDAIIAIKNFIRADLDDSAIKLPRH